MRGIQNPTTPITSSYRTPLSSHSAGYKRSGSPLHNAAPKRTKITNPLFSSPTADPSTHTQPTDPTLSSSPTEENVMVLMSRNGVPISRATESTSPLESQQPLFLRSPSLAPSNQDIHSPTSTPATIPPVALLSGYHWSPGTSFDQAAYLHIPQGFSSSTNKSQLDNGEDNVLRMTEQSHAGGLGNFVGHGHGHTDGTKEVAIEELEAWIAASVDIVD